VSREQESKEIEKSEEIKASEESKASEIKENKEYKGTEVDMFSIGVIIFIIVQGIFPFKEARKEEYFYNLLLQGSHDTYFQKVNGTGLSEDFKDLILRFFSYNGEQRPTVEQVKNHPWMNSATYDHEATRQQLLSTLAQKQQKQMQQQVVQMTKPVKVKRSAPMV